MSNKFYNDLVQSLQEVKDFLDEKKKIKKIVLKSTDKSFVPLEFFDESKAELKLKELSNENKKLNFYLVKTID